VDARAELATDRVGRRASWCQPTALVQNALAQMMWFAPALNLPGRANLHVRL